MPSKTACWNALRERWKRTPVHLEQAARDASGAGHASPIRRPAGRALRCAILEGIMAQSTIYSRVLGTGSYLPPGPRHQSGSGRTSRQAGRRDERRMDRRPHRHPRAPLRRRLMSRPAISRSIASQARDRSGGYRPAIDRSDHRRHLHAGFRVPEHGVPVAEQARHQEQRRGVRRAGRLFRALPTRSRRPTASFAAAQHRTALIDRRGNLLAHSRLQRPHHLRAVRRRRGRGDPAGVRRTGRARQARLHADGSHSEHSLHAGQRERRRGRR